MGECLVGEHGIYVESIADPVRGCIENSHMGDNNILVRERYAQGHVEGNMGKEGLRTGRRW